MSDGIQTLREVVDRAIMQRRFFKMSRDTGIDAASLEAFAADEETLPDADLKTLTEYVYEGRRTLDLVTDTLKDVKPAPLPTPVMATPLLQPVASKYDPSSGGSLIRPFKVEDENDRSKRMKAFHDRDPGMSGVAGGH